MFNVTSPKRVKANMKAFLCAVLILFPFLSAARVIINVKYIEETTGYSISSFPAAHFITVTVLAVVVILMSKLFELKYLTKDFDPTKGDYTPTNISPYSEIIYNKASAIVVFMSAFLGFAMITSFFLLIFNLFSGTFTANSIISAILILSLALSGMFFIISATNQAAPRRKYYTFLSFAPVLWASMRIIMYFMDTTRYMNTTSHHLTLFSSMAIAVFFLFQSRFTLSDYKYHKMGTFFASGLVSLLFVSCSSLPSLVSVAFFPYTLQNSNENDIIFWLLDVIIAFYIVTRLFCVLSQIDKITDEDLKDYARGYTESISEDKSKK